jgi:hypothetical protein
MLIKNNNFFSINRSAYIFFATEEGKKVREELPGLSAPDVLREVGKRWNLLASSFFWVFNRLTFLICLCAKLSIYLYLGLVLTSICYTSRFILLGQLICFGNCEIYFICCNVSKAVVISVIPFKYLCCD